MQLVKNIDIKEYLGCTYTCDSSTFRVFAPHQEGITLAIYNEYDDVFRREFAMEKDGDYFCITIYEDLRGKYYTYIVGINEVTDPYSTACSINSRKSAIVNLRETDPPGFRQQEIPQNRWQEAIIYEVHVADFTGLESSGVAYRAKFLGMAEENTFFENVRTGLDHLVELGVTHVHLLPVYDYITVDESINIVYDYSNYNWGYDPELYNCLEGSFSTNPYSPTNRIYEFKYLVQKLHEKGISVVMDVVYNHTFKSRDSNFNVLAPNYYHRNTNGIFSNGSGCGNEFASEKELVSDFIVNSLLYWATEYKIDGFRFDLMALIDIDTIKLAIKKLRDINPNTIIYGEPWMADSSLLSYDKQINIGAQKGEDFAIFNPFYRDAIRGDNDGTSLGYVQGNFGLKNEIEQGITSYAFDEGGTNYFQSPLESINYFNAHDNLIFQDKLIKSGVDEKLRDRMTIFTFSLIMMSQGLPFFHAGNEFLRSKKLDHNSYHSSLDVNGIDWSEKKAHLDTFNTIKDLISFRKKLGIFNMESMEEIRTNIELIKGLKNNLIGYFINKEDVSYLIIHNASTNSEKVLLEEYQIKDLNLIWANGYEDRKVEEIAIEGLTSNVYEIRGMK